MKNNQSYMDLCYMSNQTAPTAIPPTPIQCQPPASPIKNPNLILDSPIQISPIV